MSFLDQIWPEQVETARAFGTASDKLSFNYKIL